MNMEGLLDGPARLVSPPVSAPSLPPLVLCLLLTDRMLVQQVDTGS